MTTKTKNSIQKQIDELSIKNRERLYYIMDVFGDYYDKIDINSDRAKRLMLKYVLYFDNKKPTIKPKDLKLCPKCFSDLATHHAEHRKFRRACRDCAWRSELFIQRTPIEKAIVEKYHSDCRSGRLEIIDGYGNCASNQSSGGSEEEARKIAKKELERLKDREGGPYRVIIWPRSVEVKGKLLELSDLCEDSTD